MSVLRSAKNFFREKLLALFLILGKTGLSLDKEKNLFRCQAETDNQPMLYAVPCDNPNACKLERKFFDDEDEVSWCDSGLTL